MSRVEEYDSIYLIAETETDGVKPTRDAGTAVASRIKAHATPPPPTLAPRTTLLSAAKDGNVENVRMLLKSGASLTTMDSKNRSPIMIASERGQLDVVKVLIDAKADVNMSQQDGLTATMIASREGHADIVQALCDGGANINATTSKNGTNAIMLASQLGHADVVSVLCRAGARVNMRSKDGWTVCLKFYTHIQRYGGGAREWNNARCVEYFGCVDYPCIPFCVCGCVE